MKNNLLKSIFSSGLQAIAVQIIGVAFFFVISIHLSKDDFGLISMLNAISMMIATLLSFGLEQVVVRRIAASKTSDWAAAAYLFHAFAGSVLGFLLLWVISSIAGSDKFMHFLPWFFAAQAIMYIGTPLKQFLNAKQRFMPYGVIALIGNICKITFAFLLVFSSRLSVTTVYMVLITCAAIELGGLLFYVLTKTDFSFKFKKKAYPKLIKEALPQYLLVIFDSSLSRLDVILMGVIANMALTGEYSFAYRAFELSRLPIVVIAPIILAKFARMFGVGTHIDENKKKEVATLFSVEMFLAMMIPLILNILWSPIMDYVTKGKYGHSNATEFMILSVCIPFQFAINILWTLAFASKKYKAVTTVTIISAVANLLLNLVMIPILGGNGAAIAFLLTTILQAALYYSLVRKRVMHLPVKALIAFIVAGAVSYYIAVSISGNIILQLPLAVILYFAFSFGVKQISVSHFLILKSYLQK